MSHPLLTEVLDRSWLDAAPESFDDPVVSLIAAIPPDIADRLEWALDSCAVCGNHVPFKASHEKYTGHAFQPLVPE
jgi:hypothetical protein